MDAFVVTLIVLVVIFILVRVFWLWYWRINVGIRLLTEIRDELRQLRRAQMGSVAVADAQAVGDVIRLPRKVMLRPEQRNNAPASDSVLRGTVVTVLRVEKGWAWIATDDGREGWVDLTLLEA